MEMGLLAGAFVMSALSALCSVAALVVLLIMADEKVDENPTNRPADDHPTPNVEMRRRQAVQAAEHRNFMDYDGSPQQPVDPNTILADGG